ncbi:MAG: nucleotidyltransferase domain-containing protein [Terriglobia bacterium]
MWAPVRQSGEQARTIVERFHPRRVILFGSHAGGDAQPDSDLDFLVETVAQARGLAHQTPALGSLRSRRLRVS